MCLALGHVLSLHAEPPKLGSISADHFQRGTSARATLRGEHLSSASRIVVDGAPGVSAKIVPPGDHPVSVESSLGGISTVAPVDEKSLRIALEIAPEAPLVERELRVVTPDGISNPLPFHLG